MRSSYMSSLLGCREQLISPGPHLLIRKHGGLTDSFLSFFMYDLHLMLIILLKCLLRACGKGWMSRRVKYDPIRERRLCENVSLFLQHVHLLVALRSLPFSFHPPSAPCSTLDLRQVRLAPTHRASDQDVTPAWVSAGFRPPSGWSLQVHIS